MIYRIREGMLFLFGQGGGCGLVIVRIGRILGCLLDRGGGWGFRIGGIGEGVGLIISDILFLSILMVHGES
jgi:hypothetical protein